MNRRRCEVVAELSANHGGSLARAMEIIQSAAKAGADAVKLQCWSEDQMAHDPQHVVQAGPWKGRNLRDLYREAWLPWDWFPKLIGLCEELRLRWFSSVFDAGALAFLERMGCPRYKIASFELTDTALLWSVAQKRKPVVISTGMASRQEIQAAAQILKGVPSVTWLHCVSAYPAQPQDYSLATMQALPWATHSPLYGVSDHTLSSDIAFLAAGLGADMLEKHLTLSRSHGGLDAAFSAEPEEFAYLVQRVKLAFDLLGDVCFGARSAEQLLDLRRKPGQKRGA